jgi:hypothetical protein
MTITRVIGVRSWLLTAALLLTFGTGAHAAFISLTATLTGLQETPPNASPGTGSAAFVLDNVAGTLVSAVTFADLTAPTTVAHIHEGPPGVSGPIIHPFATLPVGVTSGSFADVWTGLTAAQMTALETGNTYINIHTTAFPAGEIRGQITPVTPVVPEPSSLLMGATAALAGLGLAWRPGRKPA